MKKQLIKESKIITEINRVQELMGLKRNILNENVNLNINLERVPPLLTRLLKSVIGDFPTSKLEDILGGNALNIAYRLKTNGVYSIEDLLEHLESKMVNVEKSFINAEFETSLLRSVSSKVFTDTKFYNIAKEILPESFSIYKTGVKLSDGTEMSLQDVVSTIIEADLTKNPELSQFVESLFTKLKKVTNLPDHDEVIKFIRKEIDDSKSGNKPIPKPKPKPDVDDDGNTPKPDENGDGTTPDVDVTNQDFLDDMEGIGDELIDEIIDAGDKSLARVKKLFGSAWAKIVYSWDKIGDWTLLLRKYSGLNGPLEGVFTSFPFKQVANAPGLSIIAKKMHLTYDKLMVSPIQIKKDLDEIFERILVKLESGANTDITEEQLELTAKFSQFLAKRNESHKIIFDQWMILWKEDGRLKRLFNPTQKRPTGQLDANENPIFYDVPEPLYFKNGWSDPKFIQMMEAFETAKGNNVGAIKQTYNKIYGSIQLAKNLIKIIPHRRPTIKNFMNYGANVLELIQRLIGALAVYTPNTYKEVAHNIRVLGKGRWFGVGLGQKIVMSTIDIPLILASYRTIGSFIQDYVNSRRLAQTKPGQPLPKEMKWWLLSDEEWSIMTSGPDGDAFKTTILFFGESFKKFSITNTKELTNSVLPWTIAGWAYFEKFKGDWKVSDFYDQFNSVESNSKENLNKVNTEAVKDTNLNKIVKDNNIQTYEETSNKIDTALKTRPKLVPTEEANY